MLNKNYATDIYLSVILNFKQDENVNDANFMYFEKPLLLVFCYCSEKIYCCMIMINSLIFSFILRHIDFTIVS